VIESTIIRMRDCTIRKIENLQQAVLFGVARQRFNMFPAMLARIEKFIEALTAIADGAITEITSYA
jgi:hypothetical protein